VPGEPLLQPHAKSVDVLVELLDESDRLDDGLVLPVDVGRALGPREAVAQTERGLPHVLLFDLYLVCLKATVSEKRR